VGRREREGTEEDKEKEGEQMAKEEKAEKDVNIRKEII
jgi:hypothetical protein